MQLAPDALAHSQLAAVTTEGLSWSLGGTGPQPVTQSWTIDSGAALSEHTKLTKENARLSYGETRWIVLVISAMPGHACTLQLDSHWIPPQTSFDSESTVCTLKMYSTIKCSSKNHDSLHYCCKGRLAVRCVRSTDRPSTTQGRLCHQIIHILEQADK